MGKGGPGLSRDARQALLHHRWPGNIRELANAVERALIVQDAGDGLISTADFGLTAPPPAPADHAGPAAPRPAPPVGGSIADWERQLFLDALGKAKGNKSHAARLLGLTRSQLYTRMQRYGLGE